VSNSRILFLVALFATVAVLSYFALIKQQRSPIGETITIYYTKVDGTTEAPWIVQELCSSPWSSKLIFGFRETNLCYIIDPEIPDPTRRVTPVKLSTRLKNVHFGSEEKDIV